MPYQAMKHFADEVAGSRFNDEHRRYCLPVMDSHIIRCTEESFDHSLGESESNLVKYQALDVYANTTDGDQHRLQYGGMYRLISPYPRHNLFDTDFRINDDGKGVFFVKAIWTPDYYATNLTVVTAANNGFLGIAGRETGTIASDVGYGTLLYRMMYGNDPGPDVLKAVPANSSFVFVAKCEFASIAEEGRYSSWRQVDFTLKDGVMKSNVTEERCANPRAPLSGYPDIYFTLEGATSILAGSDGYSQLFNKHPDPDPVAPEDGSSIFTGMSRLDATVNKLYHLTQTSYAATVYEYAVQNPNVSAHPTIMTDYPHLYVVNITWTPTTYIGLALSLLITINAYILFGRWITAVYRFGDDAETWNLLSPIDLIAYSLENWRALPELRTVEQRRMAFRRGTIILREHSVSQSTRRSQGSHSQTYAAIPNHPATCSDGKR